MDETAPHTTTITGEQLELLRNAGALTAPGICEIARARGINPLTASWQLTGDSLTITEAVSTDG